MKKYAFTISISLMLLSSVFGNEYMFVGNRGSFYTMIQGEECINHIGSVFIRDADIRESMYSIENGEFLVYILADSRRICRFSEESKITKKYEYLTERREYHSGLFYDYESHSIASAYIKKDSKKGRLLEKDKFYLLNDKDKKEKEILENCLFIWCNSPPRYFPGGEFKKKDFALKNPKSADKIQKGGQRWTFSGQSKLWVAYSYLAVGNANGYSENTTWVKNRKTGWETVYSIKDCIQHSYVYPDVVLLFTKKRLSKTHLYPPLPTRDFYIQLPNEEELRKIQMDPKAKHLWANAESVFFQLGKDILRVDYADGQKEPVKICEIEDELFCMFEKDNILAALAEDDKPNKKEKDKNKEEN